MNNTLILAQKLEDCKKMIIGTGESPEIADGIVTMMFEETGIQYLDLLELPNSNDVNRAINHIDDLFASYPKTKMKLI